MPGNTTPGNSKESSEASDPVYYSFYTAKSLKQDRTGKKKKSGKPSTFMMPSSLSSASSSAPQLNHAIVPVEPTPPANGLPTRTETDSANMEMDSELTIEELQQLLLDALAKIRKLKRQKEELNHKYDSLKQAAAEGELEHKKDRLLIAKFARELNRREQERSSPKALTLNGTTITLSTNTSDTLKECSNYGDCVIMIAELFDIQLDQKTKDDPVLKIEFEKIIFSQYTSVKKLSEQWRNFFRSAKLREYLEQ